MHIEDGEALKTWLQKTLTTVSDADPQSLSRYVLALLKKDKPESELKSFCVEQARAFPVYMTSLQLDVFLGKETHAFVDSVFSVVGTKAYMPGGAVDAQPAAKTSSRSSRESTRKRTSSGGAKKEASSSAAKKESSSSSSKREVPKKEERSSTRSSTRATASRREDVEHASEPSATSRKRVGAPSSTVESSSSHRNGKSDRSRSPVSRSGVERTTITVHSRLGPPVRTVRTGRGGGSPKRHSRSRSPRRREVRRVGRAPIDDLSSGSASSDEEVVSSKRARRRCVDYDEKGYCMLGDACQFDHGPDPVVVNDSQALPSMITRSRADFDPSMPPPTILPPGVDGPPGVGRPPVTAAQPVVMMQPNAPQFANFAFANMSQPPPSLPVQFTQPPPPIFPSHGTRSRIVAPPRFRAPGQSQDSKTLIISKNNIGTLDSHFKQFGPITNVKVNYAGKHDQALITYSDRYNALQAFKSTQPILNNRFIKCFWFDGDIDAPAGAQDDGMHESGMISKTLYNRGALRKRAPEHDRPAYKTTAAAQHEYVAERKARKDHHAKRVAVNDVFNSHVKIAEESVKQQKELVAKMESCTDTAKMKEMTKLFKMIEASGKSANKEAARLKEQLQRLDETKPVKPVGGDENSEWRRQRAVDVRTEQQHLKAKMRKTSLSSSQELSMPTKTEIDDEVLVKENESTELMERMAQLKKELITLGSTRGRGGHTPRRGGRGGARGRGGRRVPPSIQQLDKRPTTLLITKFESNEKNELTSHLEQFGTVASCEFEMKAGELRAVAKYSSRKAAEQAHELASDFKERTIVVEWAPNRTPRASLSGEKHESPEKATVDRRVSASQLLANLDDELSDGGDDDDEAFETGESIVKEEGIDV